MQTTLKSHFSNLFSIFAHLNYDNTLYPLTSNAICEQMSMLSLLIYFSGFHFFSSPRLRKQLLMRKLIE